MRGDSWKWRNRFVEEGGDLGKRGGRQDGLVGGVEQLARDRPALLTLDPSC